jgi:hypothetical protein
MLLIREKLLHIIPHKRRGRKTGMCLSSKGLKEKEQRIQVLFSAAILKRDFRRRQSRSSSGK